MRCGDKHLNQAMDQSLGWKYWEKTNTLTVHGSFASIGKHNVRLSNFKPLSRTNTK